MCGSRKAPKVVERDLEAEQRQAEAKAATESNLELAARRKRRRESSLLTIGAAGLSRSTGTPSLLAGAVGKSSLGGG